jgi:hypothetical protein
MGARTDEIALHIQAERNELNENIRELETKVRSTMDWRTQTQDKPFAMVAIAFVAGALVSRLLPK